MDLHESFALDVARAFVARLDFGEFALPADDVAPPDLVFDAAKQQSVLVGSDVVSFDTGVEADFREAASNCALLAQLAADKATSADADPMAWFDSYFSVLAHLGWVVQERDTASYQLGQDGLEVHQAILDVVSAFLGPVAPAALELVKLALVSLQTMDAASPFITLFKRQTQHAKIGRVQFTAIHDAGNGGLLAEAMAFGLNADAQVTQILFFKLHNDHTLLRRSLGRLSLNRMAIQALAPQIKAKVLPFMASYVDALDIGTPPTPTPTT
ncbi:hypothetical protein [Sphingomonas nostoxanthinifaciens]|uniref:hypothetical protein n=1 Tax=Sphingomonas nostoxanthinifaciens TaxID=2872652 RepID=UPI001CC20CD1|nr:hypothetical protein [Sphingomonas nostoxanthinifaciens]UAK26327.1 hypothetical protein K8P63_09685 [Sphingomonas nostoxanthinifaciens]